jgi:hypothetical protein
MIRDRLTSRRGRVILVAVVGLVAGASDGAAAPEPFKSKAAASGSGPAGPAPSCEAWAEATRRESNRLGERAWHDVTIKALAHGCGAIPEQLRRAAGEVQGVKDPAARARTLATAASATLAGGCAVAEPLADAREVARTCPLPNLPSNFPYGLGEAELRDLRAVDYVIINALLKSLIAANQFDEAVQFVILDFALSSQINGETFRKREERRHRGHPGG